MEVVDKDRNQLEVGEGDILATSLYNFAMPFIRYDTTDIGYIINDICSCGRSYKLLKEITGEHHEMLLTPEGKGVHTEFFTYIFEEMENASSVHQFQVVQEKVDKIVIKIIPGDDFDEKQLPKIEETIKKRSAGWNVEFDLVDRIDKTKGGKYKFIINKIEGGGI